MATIFHDAAATLQDVKTPTRRMSPNTTRLRLPASQVRSTPFGGVRRDDTSTPSGVKILATDALRPVSETWKALRTPEALYGCAFRTPHPSKDIPSDAYSTNTDRKHLIPYSARALTPPEVLFGPASPTPRPLEDPPLNTPDIDANGREPISSGFSTPQRRHPSHSFSNSPQCIFYPTLELSNELRTLSRPQSPTSDILDCHSTHGVPLVIPIASSAQENVHRSSIDTWLTSIPEISSSSAPDQYKSPPPLPPRPSKHSPHKPTSPIKYPLLRSLSHTSSNKENAPPPSRIPSP